MILRSLTNEVLHTIQALADEGLQRLETVTYDLLASALALKCGLCSPSWQLAELDFGAEAVIIILGGVALFVIAPVVDVEPLGPWSVTSTVDDTQAPVMATGPSRCEAAQACLDQVETIPLLMPAMTAMVQRMLKEGVTLH